MTSPNAQQPKIDSAQPASPPAAPASAAAAPPKPAVTTGHQSPVTTHALLDFPHYTRPAEFRGWPVPEILLGGNHEQIRLWRQQKALEKTRRNRPDLLVSL